MTPFSQYKGWIAEGGIRNALIVSGPIVNRPKGSVNGGLMYVADLMPTLLEVAGTTYPKIYDGRNLPPLIGKSWLRVLAGKEDSPRTEDDYIGWEIFGNRAVRQGEWKIRWEFKPYGKGDWELFDLATEPDERADLAAEHPNKLQELLAVWDNYVRTNNVVLPNRSPFEALEKALPQRVPDDPGYPPLNYKQQYRPPRDMTSEPKR